MRTPISGTRFRKDVKLAERRGKDMDKLRELILLLIKGDPFAATLQRSSAGRKLAALPGLPHRAGLAPDLQNHRQQFAFGSYRRPRGFVRVNFAVVASLPL